MLKRKNLFSKKNTNKFIKTYAKKDNWHNIDKPTGNLGYGWLHYALIRNLLPERILIIGSRYGYTPAICAMACKDNKKGKVDFVDAGYDYKNPKHKDHWGGVGFWHKKQSNHFDKFGLSKYINVYVMTTKDFSKKYKKRNWGYVNIDGDHSYKGVKFDFETFWPRLLDGGFVSLHDIYTEEFGDLECGVHKYWQEIIAKYRNTTEFPGECGLGLLQKM